MSAPPSSGPPEPPEGQPAKLPVLVVAIALVSGLFVAAALVARLLLHH